MKNMYRRAETGQLKRNINCCGRNIVRETEVFQLANAGDIRGGNRGNGDFDPVSQESNPEAANTMAQLPIGAGASVRGNGGNRRLYRLDVLGDPAAERGVGEHGEQRRVCGGQACGGRQG